MTELAVLSILLLVGSAFGSLVGVRSRRLATAIAMLGGVAGCAVGAIGAFGVLVGGAGRELAMGWPEPIGPLVVGVDALSALFLVPLFVVGGLSSIYGRTYLLGTPESRSLAAPTFFFNLLIAGMALVVMARTAVLFLMAWEAMTISSYLLVTFDHQSESVRRAGWVYLIAGHVGVASLFALFLVLGRGAAALDFDALRAAASTAPAGIAIALAGLGFGIKAGFVPVHVWLPEAHAAAPSHVSAIMSAVMIKVGLYGFLRTLTFITPAAWWGPAMIVVGLLGALFGITIAAYQRDLKRVLAYSSIENMGIILLGLGVGFWGTARGDLRVAALGFAGGFLHVWSHALMKGLLFLSAGSVLHGAGTRDLERLGGLMKRMPWTSTAMILGAIAIAGFPPLAGFTGEWLIYVGLIERGMRPGPGGLGALLAVGSLALAGSVALLCFVRLVGVALLGRARGPEAENAHESSPWMTLPMGALAAAVVVVPFMPGRLLALQAPAIAELAGVEVAQRLLVETPTLDPIVLCNAAIWIALAATATLLVTLVRRRAVADETWGCGYLAPSPRMQYGAGSFSQLFAAKLVPASLRGRETVVRPESLFPKPGWFSSETGDPVTRGLYEPFFTHWADRFATLRWVQQGVLHVYLLYILVVVVGALGWVTLHDWPTT